MEASNNISTSTKKKPLLFALWYGVALALMAFLFAAFTRTPQIRPMALSKQVDVKAEGESKLVAADALLHSRFEKLQQARVNSSDKAQTERELQAFMFTLDSLEKQKTAFGLSGPQLTTLIRSFKGAATTALPTVKDTVRINGGGDLSGELTALRNQLQQKEAQVAELQRRLSVQRPAGNTAPANNSDLAVRYDRLKATLLTVEDRNHILNREIRKLKQENEILQVSMKSRNSSAPRN